MEIYYFSGTGNSLYAAKLLQRHFPESTLVPMLSVLPIEKAAVKSKVVALVFPLHLAYLPKPVRSFLEKIDLSSADYIFTVITRIGTFSFCDIAIRRYLKRQGKNLNALFYLNMADNSPTGLKPGKGDVKWIERIASDKLEAIDRDAAAVMETIAATVSARENCPVKSRTSPLRLILERVMYAIISASSKSEVGFYADQSCTGCKKCERICPSGKIVMQNNRPVWLNSTPCYYCFACFNFCPEQAILIKNKFTQKSGRYSHPSVSFEEIARQKDNVSLL